MTQYFWVVILLASVLIGITLWRNITLIIRKKRDNTLLRRVTELDRGTKSERDLILNILKYGIPAQTIFHDLILENADGTFTQIDIVIATSEGIIVLEVKDYGGWIYGNAGHSHWTQVLAYGKNKYKFYNPIRQNNGHIKALRKQLPQFENVPFFSIILFSGNCELKDINYVPEGTFIVKHPRIFEVLEHIKMNYTKAAFSDKWEVIETLKQAVKNGGNAIYQHEHITNIDDMLGKSRIYD